MNETLQSARERNIRDALAEDIGDGDWTGRLVPAGQRVRARVIARERAVLCGRDWFDGVVTALDPSATLDWHVAEGAWMAADAAVLHVEADARALVSRFARAVRSELGTRGAVALGVVGHGAFGDEPVYRNTAELIDDVGLALAAGVEHLSLFDLGGAYLRGDPDDWLDAFEIPVRAGGHARSWRAHALFAAARLLGGK